MKILNSILSLTLLSAPITVFAEDIDGCLVGYWAADLDDLGHLYADQMNASSATVNGFVGMRIYADNVARLSTDALVIDLVMPDIPPMKVTLDGGTDYTLEAVDGAFNMGVTSFEYIASATVMGNRMEIPVSSDDGLFGGGVGEYGCSDDVISFEFLGDTPKLPRRWTRVAE